MSRKGSTSGQTYEWQGQQLTMRQLADISGCGKSCLRQRLKKMDLAAAIAMGPGDRMRRYKGGPMFNTPDGLHPTTKRYTVGAETLTLKELAARAGVPACSMRARLLRHEPAVALAMGKAGLGRRVNKREPKPKPPPKPPKPAKVKQTKPPASAKLSAKSWSIGEKKADKRVLKPTEIKGEAIVTPKTVVTVAPKPRDRF